MRLYPIRNASKKLFRKLNVVKIIIALNAHWTISEQNSLGTFVQDKISIDFN